MSLLWVLNMELPAANNSLPTCCHREQQTLKTDEVFNISAISKLRRTCQYL